MTTTLKPEAIITEPTPFIEAPASRQDDPTMLVLQPVGRLDQMTSLAFQQALEQALDQASEAVIVDLLWVDFTDTHGLLALLAGIQRAAAIGKFLTFQAMAKETRSALTEMWNHQQETCLGGWDAMFEKGLESYLDQLSP